MVGSQNTAIVDKLLTNISNQYTPMGFIGEQIFPMVKVVQTTGLIGKYGTSHLRIETSVTGGKNAYPRIDTRTYTTDTYSIVTHGLSDIITEHDYANVEKPFDAEKDTTMELTLKLQLEKEKGIADSLTDTSVLTSNTTLSGTDQWSDYTNSDPVDDIVTGINTIEDAVGIAPNTAIMSSKVYRKLKYHPKLVDALGYKDNRPGGLSIDEVAQAIDVERILVGRTIYESAKEGQTSSVMPVWGKHFVLAVAPTKAALRQVTLGYRFQQFADSRRTFKNKVDNPPNAKEILVDDHYDQNIIDVNAGYLIKDAIA